MNYYATVERRNPVICDEDRTAIIMLGEKSKKILRPTHGPTHVESRKKISQACPRDIPTG